MHITSKLHRNILYVTEYGSTVKGLSSHTSDIDLAIIVGGGSRDYLTLKPSPALKTYRFKEDPYDVKVMDFGDFLFQLWRGNPDMWQLLQTPGLVDNLGGLKSELLGMQPLSNFSTQAPISLLGITRSDLAQMSEKGNRNAAYNLLRLYWLLERGAPIPVHVDRLVLDSIVSSELIRITRHPTITDGHYLRARLNTIAHLVPDRMEPTDIRPFEDVFVRFVLSQTVETPPKAPEKSGGLPAAPKR